MLSFCESEEDEMLSISFCAWMLSRYMQMGQPDEIPVKPKEKSESCPNLIKDSSLVISKDSGGLTKRLSKGSAKEADQLVKRDFARSKSHDLSKSKFAPQTTIYGIDKNGYSDLSTSSPCLLDDRVYDKFKKLESKYSDSQSVKVGFYKKGTRPSCKSIEKSIDFSKIRDTFENNDDVFIEAPPLNEAKGDSKSLRSRSETDVLKRFDDRRKPDETARIISLFETRPSELFNSSSNYKVDNKVVGLDGTKNIIHLFESKSGEQLVKDKAEQQDQPKDVVDGKKLASKSGSTNNVLSLKGNKSVEKVSEDKVNGFSLDTKEIPASPSNNFKQKYLEALDSNKSSPKTDKGNKSENVLISSSKKDEHILKPAEALNGSFSKFDALRSRQFNALSNRQTNYINFTKTPESSKNGKVKNVHKLKANFENLALIENERKQNSNVNSQAKFLASDESLIPQNNDNSVAKLSSKFEHIAKVSKNNDAKLSSEEISHAGPKIVGFIKHVSPLANLSTSESWTTNKNSKYVQDQDLVDSVNVPIDLCPVASENTSKIDCMQNGDLAQSLVQPKSVGVEAELAPVKFGFDDQSSDLAKGDLKDVKVQAITSLFENLKTPDTPKAKDTSTIEVTLDQGIVKCMKVNFERLSPNFLEKEKLSKKSKTSLVRSLSDKIQRKSQGDDNENLEIVVIEGPKPKILMKENMQPKLDGGDCVSKLEEKVKSDEIKKNHDKFVCDVVRDVNVRTAGLFFERRIESEIDFYNFKSAPAFDNTDDDNEVSNCVLSYIILDSKYFCNTNIFI